MITIEDILMIIVIIGVASIIIASIIIIFLLIPSIFDKYDENSNEELPYEE